MPWPIRPAPSTPTLSISLMRVCTSSGVFWGRQPRASPSSGSVSPAPSRAGSAEPNRCGKDRRAAESVPAKPSVTWRRHRHVQATAGPRRGRRPAAARRRRRGAALVHRLAAQGLDRRQHGPGERRPEPYGIVNVTTSAGSLVAGDILISNFNNAGSPPKGNLQGRGTTLVQLTPQGRLTLFAEISPATLPGPCPGGVGLTTALAILPQGYVVVGSLPTKNGKAKTAKAGCLTVLDSFGDPVETISGEPINGPWDMTAVSEGANATLFVTNVLNGTV